MKIEHKIPGSAQTFKDAPATKTFDIRLFINDRDFGTEVMQAFNLAKSSGRELTVCFSGAKSSP
jgi:hypothetical protein